MNEKDKMIEYAQQGLMLDTIAKFYELLSQADSIISAENFDDFSDWLDDVKVLHYHAQKRINEVRMLDLENRVSA